MLQSGPASVGNGMVGALDLGGSSTQISFSRRTNGRQQSTAERRRPLALSDAYVHSYLGMGAELSREKVQAHYSAKAVRQGVDTIACHCFFRGFSLEVVVTVVAVVNC